MYCLELAQSRALQHFLLSIPTSHGRFALPASSSTGNPAEMSFLLLQARLLLLFHVYWRRLDPPPSVMQFEEKFRHFKRRTSPCLRRGIIGGIGVGFVEDAEV